MKGVVWSGQLVQLKPRGAISKGVQMIHSYSQLPLCIRVQPVLVQVSGINIHKILGRAYNSVQIRIIIGCLKHRGPKTPIDI